MCNHKYTGNTTKKHRELRGISCVICNDFRTVNRATKFVFSDWDLNKFINVVNTKGIMQFITGDK